MSALRWVAAIAAGFLAGFLFLDVLAALFYALPRAVGNAARGFVHWGVVAWFLGGAAVYAGVLTAILLIGRWINASSGALLFGMGVAIVAKLSNLRKLPADVDDRLSRWWRAPSDWMVRKRSPAWAARWMDAMEKTMKAQQTTPCPFCHGTGTIAGQTCNHCNGAGSVDVPQKQPQ